MTTLKVDPFLLVSLLMPGLHVSIISASYDKAFGEVHFTLSGPDVPDGAETVICEVTKTQTAKMTIVK
jgi:hypothetical protein